QHKNRLKMTLQPISGPLRRFSRFLPGFSSPRSVKRHRKKTLVRKDAAKRRSVRSIWSAFLSALLK
ncbi:hypothetical protein, partial [uncultured Mailhella sp.]|uniref:hypothetical protein n=1 Tax=uncultured Mailhella sp. TaxID=1981031 RepID=UPI0025E11DAC